MIKYALTCDAGHAFEGWFPSVDGYDDQERRGLLSCAACGSAKVSKGIMAPNVSKPASAAPGPEISGGMPAELRKALRAYREQAMSGSTDVGASFANEARAIHAGERPGRKVHGTATPDEARALAEDGIPVSPLPPDPGH